MSRKHPDDIEDATLSGVMLGSTVGAALCMVVSIAVTDGVSDVWHIWTMGLALGAAVVGMVVGMIFGTAFCLVIRHARGDDSPGVSPTLYAVWFRLMLASGAVLGAGILASITWGLLWLF